MTRKGVLRIEINPELAPALKVESAIRGMRERELVNKLIRDGLSERALEFLGAARMQTASSDIPHAPKPQREITDEPQSPKASRRGKRFITDSPKTLDLIKELYGKATVREISKATGWPEDPDGWPPATIGQAIQRMRDRGEIPALEEAKKKDINRQKM